MKDKVGKSLSIREHFSYITKNNKFVFSIQKIRQFCTISVSVCFYYICTNELVANHIRLLVYSSAAKASLNLLENVQRRIRRALLFKQNWHTREDIINSYRIHTVICLHFLDVFNEVIEKILVASSLRFLHFLQSEGE